MNNPNDHGDGQHGQNQGGRMQNAASGGKDSTNADGKRNLYLEVHELIA